MKPKPVAPKPRQHHQHNYLRPQHTERSELKRQQNLLQREKNKAQAIQREEKFFMRDLRTQISKRYDTLRHSFIQQYELESVKQRERAVNQSLQVPDVEQILHERKLVTLDRLRQSQDVRHLNSDIFDTTTGTSGRMLSTLSRQLQGKLPKPGSPRRVDVFTTLGRPKTTSVDGTARLRKCWNPELEEKIERQKPIKSPCFDVEEKRPKVSASIKNRIKVNKELT